MTEGVATWAFKFALGHNCTPIVPARLEISLTYVCWCLQQMLVSPQDLNAIVARLNTQPAREVKPGSVSSQAKAMKLIYQKDAVKGFKEVYIPVKQVWLHSTVLIPLK